MTSGDQNTWGKSYYGKISELPPFDDVAADSWYYSGVMFVYEKGLIKGYSGTTLFGVGDTLTRAQLATILYRNANPGVSSDSRPSNTTGMPDVKGGEWYTAGVNWAVENGVINGYADEQGNRFAFGPADPVTFEQMPSSAETVGDQAKWLKEYDEVSLLYAGEELISIEPQMFVELEVTETEPGFKGDTVQGSTKPATLETGATIQVPMFVNIGDVLQVDTRDGRFIKRM